MKPAFYDISPVISPRIGVFPGDVSYRRKVSLDFASGHHLLLSSIETTLHVGAHADGPNHYRRGAADIAARDLGLYLGRAQVITVANSRGRRILPSDLVGVGIEAPRVLFRTLSFPDPDRWNSDFAALSPDLIDHLADRGVRLVGIDTPSVDPEDSKELESHQRIADRDLAILEGIVLHQVPDGIYTLIAPPLRLEAADAAPVRALLLTDPMWLTRSGA